MGGKKQQRAGRAAAATAAHAASRKKTSAVEVSARNEARIREVLEAIAIDESEAPSAPASGIKQLRSKIESVYEELHRHGFAPAQIQQALSALPARNLDAGAALDWLCYNLDAGELPSSLANAGRGPRGDADGPVKVRVKADDARDPGPQEAASAVKDAEAEAQRAQRAREAEEAQAQRRKQEEAEEAARRKAMIMQYAEAMSDSGEEEEEEDADEAIEDWELRMWADPREVERRRAERARAKVPPEVRRSQLGSEWRAARKEAAAAKSASDKARQKAAGQMIRDLKQEMASFGITEEDLEAEQQQEEDQGGEEEEECDLFADDGEQEGEGGSGEGQRSDAPKVQEEKDDDDDDDEPMDLFGDDEEVAAAMGCTVEEMEKHTSGGPSVKEEITDPWLLSQGYGAQPRIDPAGKKKKQQQKQGSPARGSAPAVPKALLQQHCLRMGWPAPRYEKLDYVRGDQLRYKIILPAGAAGPGKQGSKKPGGGSSKQGAGGVGFFQLREVEDGFATVQEAQNATATYALGCLMPDQPLHLILPEPYASLSRTWKVQQRADEEAQAMQRQRDEIISALVEQKATELAASGDSSGVEGAPGPEVEDAGVAEDWQSHALGAAEEQSLPESGLTMTTAQKEEGAKVAEEQRAWEESEEGLHWTGKRANLPVWKIKEELLAAMRARDIVVVSGDTGCGKTTQVPQYILESEFAEGRAAVTHVICTQPRRIAAVSVAERVAVERAEPAPGSRGARVGYHVRLDAATTKDTRLTFCTTGILLRRLAGDGELSAVSHVVVDEVHERTLQGDFLMALLRRLAERRRAAGRPLKVILMSATLDAKLFADYFGGAPVLHAEGRTFPVTRYFLEDVYEMTSYKLEADAPAALREGSHRGDRRRLEQAAGSDKAKLLRAGWGDDSGDVPLNPDYDPELYSHLSMSTRRNLGRVDEHRIDFDLLEELVVHIDDKHDDGAVLVFLPGMGEISTLYERLTGSFRFRGEAANWVLPLHSTVSPEEQRRAFATPPKGIRKIVLATNIAETSLTIEDVVFVIDTGKLKERRYDAAKGMSLLVEDFVSKAASKQRAGRAGRVRSGYCFSLFTSFRHENRMRKFQVPEMLRVPLEEMVLQIHLLSLGKASGFLASVLEPPPAKSVDAAISALQTVGALTAKDETLTPLGHHIAQLPVDARIGKLLLIGTALGCLSPVLTIAACLSYKSPFQSQYDQQQAMEQARAALASPGSKTIAAGQQSDHLVMVAAYQGWAEAYSSKGASAARDFARRHFLSFQTLQMLGDMRAQFAAMMAEIGFLDAPKGASRRSSASRGTCWADNDGATWNLYQSHAPVLKAALTAALYPNIAVMDESAGRSGRPSWNDGTQEVALHPQSLNHPLEASAFLRPYMIYLEKMRTSRVFLRDCSIVSPMSLLLFGGELQVSHEGGYVLMGNWVRIRASAQTAVLVKKARAALQGMLQRHIGGRRHAPSSSSVSSSSDREVMSAIVALLIDEETDRLRNAV